MRAGHAHGEYYALIVFSVVGMAVMVMAGDLFTFFLGLETMSIAVYALTGLRAERPSLARSGPQVLPDGGLRDRISPVWHHSRSTERPARWPSAELTATQRAGADALLSTDPMLRYGGRALFLSGSLSRSPRFLFICGRPIPTRGPPRPITGFMAVGVKAAAFARDCCASSWSACATGPSLDDPGLAGSMLSVMAVLTIVVGNAMALVQDQREADAGVLLGLARGLCAHRRGGGGQGRRRRAGVGRPFLPDESTRS